MSKDNEILRNEIVNEQSLKNSIYMIRGQQVMLDSDLAAIYGYSTSDFNRQVKNNIEKFPEDFYFQLTERETNTILICKNSTSSWGASSKDGGNRGTTMTLVKEASIYHSLIDQAMQNESLILK